MRTLLIILLLLTQLVAKEQKPTLRLQTYEVITEVQTLLETSKYSEAQTRLDDYAPDVKNSPYDAAYLQTIYGYLYISQEQYAKALSAYEKAYAAKILTDEMQLNVLYNMAQLYMSVERYRECANALEQWFAKTTKAKSANYMMYANALMQLKDYTKALDAVKQAIKRSETPNESHYQSLFYLHYELKNSDASTETLQTIIKLFEPKKQYWMQLSGLYTQQNLYKKALAALEIAYREGMLTQESELLQLIQLYLYEEIPYPAAVILEKGIKAEQITASEKNLKLLGSCWIQSREMKKAIAVYTKAADSSPDGEIYHLLAKLYADVQNWDGVIDATHKAIEKGIKQEGEAYFMQGLALFEKEELLMAKQAFSKAQRDPATAKQAKQWIQYLSD